MHKPFIEVTFDDAGRPTLAEATTIITASPQRIWAFISDVEQYPGTIPMLHRVRRTGDRVTAQLRFKISLFAVTFEFTADARYEEPHWLELRWVAGEPRDLRIRFDLEALGDGTTRARATIGFDLFSLGWMAKYFLRHHPEIQFGVLPGSALVLVDAMRRRADTR